jgi:hypothetical protein
MYTKLDDIAFAKKLKQYIEMNPEASLKKIVKDNYTNYKRLHQLEADGYIKLPASMPLSLRNKEYYCNKNNGMLFNYAVVPDPNKNIVYKNRWSPFKMRRHVAKYPHHIIIDFRSIKSHEDPLNEQQKWLVDFQRSFESDHQAV